MVGEGGVVAGDGKVVGEGEGRKEVSGGILREIKIKIKGREERGREKEKKKERMKKKKSEIQKVRGIEKKKKMRNKEIR